MSDLAQRFHETRDRLGISMEDAERGTKIRRRYIEAIEAGDFGRLPDGPPSRGFIKNYARYLGLDPEQSLNDFEAEVGVPITQLSEVIPPPPEHQQAISRYTQLVKLPVRRQKPPPPAEGQADGNGSVPANGTGLSPAIDNGNGRTLLRHAEKQPLSNSFSLRSPEVTQAGDVRPFQTGRSPLSLRSMIGANSPEAAGKGYKYGSMSMPGALSGRSGQWNSRTITVLGMAAAGVVLVVALIGLVLIPALQRGSALAVAPAPTATQVIKITILGATPAGGDIPAPAFTPIAGAGAGANAAITKTAQTTVPTPSAVATGASVAAPTAAAAVQAAPQTVQPLAGGGVQLILDARERAWVRVRIDGSVVFEGIPQIGPNATWRGQNTVGVETGNAGAFDVIINNTRLGPAGARNATVNLSWDATGKPISN